MLKVDYEERRRMMTTVTNEGFKGWMNSHPARKAYDSNPAKVCKLCSGQTDPVTKFKTLAENKNLVLLTKASFGRKCQATFFHSLVGVPINPEDTHYVVVSGMENSNGVEVEPKSLFASTPANHVPTLLELMKIESKGDLDNLKPPSSGAKKKINAFAVLTPKLAEA